MLLHRRKLRMQLSSPVGKDALEQCRPNDYAYAMLPGQGEDGSHSLVHQVVPHLDHIARMGNHNLQLESGTLVTRDTPPVKSGVNTQPFEQGDGGKR